MLVLPDHERMAPALDELRERITEVGGEATVLRGTAWGDAGYRGLAAECGEFLEEIAHEFAIEKFTPAELEEEEAELDKLERWWTRIGERDLLGASEAAAAGTALTRARQELERYARAVYERSVPAA